MSELDTQKQAQFVVDALNRIIGSFHAARCTHAIWIQQSGNAQRKQAVKYGLQIAFGVMVLMLRKFTRLWRHHMQYLIPQNEEARKKADSILTEYSSRNLGPTVNKLFAHYAGDERDLPLSTDEVERLIRSNKWNTEEEVSEWSGLVLSQLILIRDDLICRYNVTLSEEEGSE